MTGGRVYSRHTDPLETRMLLLDYLSSTRLKTRTNEISFTRAIQVMNKNARDGNRFIDKMQKEGLINVQRTDGEWVKGLISITSKGVEVGQMLIQMISMMTTK